MRSGLILLALSLSASTSLWAQITVENAGTISPETPIWQSRLEYAKTEHTTDIRLLEKFDWAPNEVMDFELAVPLVHRDVEFDAVDGTLEGIGDASLRGKYLITKVDDVMASTRFAVLGGVRLPTGDFDEEEDGVELPRKMQLGTGAFGFYGGPLFTYINDRHRFAAELIGRYNLERDDFQVGPSLQIGLSYWYRITPATIEVAGAETEIRGVIEVTSTFYWESELPGEGTGDDGNITWLSPGVQIYPAFWALFEFSVQIPIVETVEDDHGDRKFGVLATMKFLF
jgi:outer membrane putative beta-barrel porin/alpha-amylase